MMPEKFSGGVVNLIRHAMEALYDGRALPVLEREDQIAAIDCMIRMRELEIEKLRKMKKLLEE